MNDTSIAVLTSAPIASRERISAGRVLWIVARGVASAVEWTFGLISLVLGLAILAALPVVQFASLGYLLESAGRVARTGRLRDGLIGVRLAARVGGVVAGSCVAMGPLWLVRS